MLVAMKDGEGKEVEVRVVRCCTRPLKEVYDDYKGTDRICGYCGDPYCSQCEIDKVASYGYAGMYTCRHC